MGLGSGGSEVSTPRRRVDLPSSVWLIATAGFVVQLLAAAHYGYFRDELYYLACTRRLDWGYVDQPPLSIGLLWAWTRIFGTSLISIRVPMALCYAGTVLVNAKTTQDLSSTKWASIIAASATAAAPVYMVVGHFYAMNGLDVLLTAMLVQSWLRAAEGPLYWWSWGILLGLCLLNKWSGLWIVAAMLLGMLMTSRRSELKCWIPWAAACLGSALAVPSLAWQAQNHWPMVEFLQNARQYKMLPVMPWQFLFTQVAVMNVLAAPVWLSGAIAPLLRRDAKKTSAALSFVIVMAILMFSMKSRANYLSPAMALVMPFGSIEVASWLEKRFFWRCAGLSLVGASALVHSLLVLPLLPVESLKQVLMRLPSPPSDERGPKSPLQGHADTLGWKEMADATLSALESLPSAERDKTVVLASNYGEAAALEFYGVPKVICPHNNFYLWGPGDWNGSTALLVGRSPAFDSRFSSVRVVGRTKDSDATPEEARMPIRLGMYLKMPARDFWSIAKRFE